MANGQGGSRTPANPAPVSGPGALSQRTDGGQPARWISGDQYGEGKENMDLQTSAPMSKAARTPQAPRVAPTARQMAPTSNTVTPLFAPTQRPDEPLTAGMPFGAGSGPDATSSGNRTVLQTLEKLLPYDDSGSLRMFYNMALKQGW